MPSELKDASSNSVMDGSFHSKYLCTTMQALSNGDEKHRDETRDLLSSTRKNINHAFPVDP